MYCDLIEFYKQMFDEHEQGTALVRNLQADGNLKSGKANTK